MKVTFNFYKGTIINDEIVERAEGYDNYTLEQITQILESLKKGYKIRCNYNDRDPIVIEAEQVESVNILL